MKNYGFAVNYARLFVGNDWCKDLVHSTYLNYYTKTGDNLFEKDVPLIKTYVKYASLNFLRTAGKAKRSGFQMIGYEDWMIDNIHPFDEQIDATNKLALLRATIQTNHPRAKDKMLLILEYKLQGYGLVELTELINLTYKTIREYWALIMQYCRDLNMSETTTVNNPFNGNKARPIKKISLRVYEDKYKEDYTCDFDRQWCDENETTMLVVHKDKEEYILVKKGKD